MLSSNSEYQTYFRDGAVESKNAAEVDLAKNRIEMMQVG